MSNKYKNPFSLANWAFAFVPRVSRILFSRFVVSRPSPTEERIFTAAFGESFKRGHAAELVGRDLSEPQSNASQTSSKEKMKLRDSIVARSLIRMT